MLIALLVPIALATIVFTFVLLRAAIEQRATPTLEGVILGAITNFFDTLGIGSFAPTTAWFKFRRLVPDRILPQTMLVGHSLPTLAEAAIFQRIYPVGIIGQPQVFGIKTICIRQDLAAFLQPFQVRF